MLVSVIIPVYNEKATIAAIIEKVKSVVLPAGLKKEIVIVDDGSQDGTKNILARYGGMPGLLIMYQENQGKTGAVLTGLRAAQGDVFIIQDADLEYDPAQYPELLEPIIRGESQVVYGSRFMGDIKGMKLINRIANNISNCTINLLYQTKMTDINTCYKVFTRKAYEGITITGKHFDIDTELTSKLLRKGLTIKEVSIRYSARSRAEGKKIKWSTALAMYWMILKFRFKST